MKRSSGFVDRSLGQRAGAALQRIIIDVDATLIGAHSEKEGAAGNFKGGFGFHPLLAYLDGSREALAAVLRPGNAGANTAADHVGVVELALEQLPRDVVEHTQIVVRTDSAGATHELTYELRAARINFLIGFDLIETVRAAILALPEAAWRPAVRQDGDMREGAWVAEITDALDPAGEAVRRGAQVGPGRTAEARVRATVAGRRAA